MPLRLLDAPLYARLKRSWLAIKDLESGREVGGKTALDGGTDGFSHPRALVGDFEAAFTLVQKRITELKYITKNRALFRPAILVQVLENLAGGMTELEKRAIYELFEPMARQVVVIEDSSELSSEEVLEKLKKK